MEQPCHQTCKKVKFFWQVGHKYCQAMDQAPREECVTENFFFYLSTKTYVVDTQKKRLNETVIETVL